jgi:hypothetical protein
LVLGVLVVGVLCLGFYLGWFTFTVDKNKIGADVNRVTGHSDEKTGTIKTVEVAENRFTMKTDGDPDMMVLLVADSKVWRNKAASALTDLKAGDEVTVKFQDKAGKHEASSVTVVQK